MGSRLLTGAQSVSSNEQVLRDAVVLRRVLERDGKKDQAKASGQPILVALSGLPGTGKSHFAGELTKLAPFMVLESDRVRKLLAPKPKYTPQEHARVFKACHLLIEDYLSQGCRVLFDATNLTESFRRPLYQISDRLTVPLALLKFTAPVETIRQRLRDRAAGLHPGNNSDADWLIYCRLSPYEETIQRPHFNVDSSTDISPTVIHIARLANHQQPAANPPVPTMGGLAAGCCSTPPT